MRQKQLETRKINNIVDDEEEPVIGALGSSSEEEGLTTEEVVFALKNFKKQKEAKKLTVNMISSYEVHALSLLPFVHIAIGKGNRQRKVKALVDCGSSVTLINISLLRSIDVPFKRRPFDERVLSFSCNVIGTDGQAELDLTIGSKTIVCGFIICTGNIPYDLVLGIDFQRKQNLCIINTSDGTHFLHGGEKIECKALSDPVAALDEVSSLGESMVGCSIQSQQFAAAGMDELKQDDKKAIEVDDDQAHSIQVNECGRCGAYHPYKLRLCLAFGQKCFRCRKRGHLAKRCFASVTPSMSNGKET